MPLSLLYEKTMRFVFAHSIKEANSMFISFFALKGICCYPQLFSEVYLLGKKAF